MVRAAPLVEAENIQDVNMNDRNRVNFGVTVNSTNDYPPEGNEGEDFYEILDNQSDEDSDEFEAVEFDEDVERYFDSLNQGDSDREGMEW